MKKTLLILLFGVISLGMFAQKESEELYFDGVESSTVIVLTTNQTAKIKKLNREVAPKFRAIGQDRSLSGYEKGQKKRALALKHKEDIRKILTADQIKTWEQMHGSMSQSDGLKNIITDDYNSKLDRLEDKYDAAKDAIEDNDSLSKSEKKAQLKALKEAYKADKEKLKDQKRAVKETDLLKQ